MNDKIDEKDFLRDEYNNLRQEVGIRIGIRFTIVQIALGAFGTIIGFGFQTNNPSLMLLYPPLAVVLLAIFISNSYETQRIGDYIKNYIEAQVDWKLPENGQKNGGWQTFVSSNQNEGFALAGYLGARSILLLTELFAILAAIFTKPEATFFATPLGISKPAPDARVNVLLVIALICFLLTLIMTIFISDLVPKLIETVKRLSTKTDS